MFTVLSFWWINARPGRIKSFEPHTFAAYFAPPELTIRLPLVLYNTGAVPIVVRGMRLRLSGQGVQGSLLHWSRSRSTLDPSPDDQPRLPAVFVVAPRQATQHFVEFSAPFAGSELEPRSYALSVEAQLQNRTRWRPILEYTFNAQSIRHPQNFIVYENSPESWGPTQVEEATAALAQANERSRALDTKT